MKRDFLLSFSDGKNGNETTYIESKVVIYLQSEFRIFLCISLKTQHLLI